MPVNAISTVVHHLERHPPATLDLGTRARLRDMLQGAVAEHQRLRERQPEDARAEFDEVFAADLRQVEDSLRQIEDSIENDPDPFGEPAQVVSDDGQTMNVWTDEQVAAMQPFYAAYVRAHGGTVPANRNDLAARWIDEQRQAFFVETRGAPVPRWEYNSDPVTGSTNSGAWMKAVLETQDEFAAWLGERHQAAPRADLANAPAPR